MLSLRKDHGIRTEFDGFGNICSKRIPTGPSLIVSCCASFRAKSHKRYANLFFSQVASKGQANSWSVYNELFKVRGKRRRNVVHLVVVMMCVLLTLKLFVSATTVIALKDRKGVDKNVILTWCKKKRWKTFIYPSSLFSPAGLQRCPKSIKIKDRWHFWYIYTIPVFEKKYCRMLLLCMKWPF